MESANAILPLAWRWGLRVPSPSPGECRGWAWEPLVWHLCGKEGQLLWAASMRGAVPRPRGTGNAALACSPEPLLCAAREQEGLFLSERQL